MTRLPLKSLRYIRELWPREGIDMVRVVMFVALLAEGVELEPIIVVPRGDGTYLIADGVHRWWAAVRAGLTDILVVVVNPDVAETLEDCVYRVALETSTRSALPLTRAERRRAGMRLIEKKPHLSHREVARMIGVSHSTIDKWAKEGTEGDGEPATEEWTVGPTCAKVAGRLASYLAKLEDAQGLFDMLSKARMARHLADACESQFGEGARAHLQRLAKWANDGVAELRARGI